MKFPNIASFLKSATTNINIASATAPTSGQVLTATSSTTADWQTPSAGGGSSTKSTFVAGENITAGNALRNGFSGIISTTSISQTSDSGSSEAYNFGQTGQVGRGQTFIATGDQITSITLKLSKQSSPTDNVSVNVYNGVGGSLLGTSNVVAGSTLSTYTRFTIQNFTFSSPISITNGNTYYFEIVRSGSLDSTNVYRVWESLSNPYTGGSAYLYDGSNRTISPSSTYDLYFVINENILSTEDASKVYKTDASNSSKINFIGFATNTVSTGGNVIVDTSGVSVTQSGLTIGSDYYLSNTPGAISTTPGTNIVNVGKAVSATGIELNTNPTRTYTSALSVTSNTTTTINCGFRPRNFNFTFVGTGASATKLYSICNAPGLGIIRTSGDTQTYQPISTAETSDTIGKLYGNTRLRISNITNTGFDIISEFWSSGYDGNLQFSISN